jgi:hypothetical protein
MKSNQVVLFAENGGHLVFRVAGVDGSITLSVDSLSPETLRIAAIHGLKQKISDRAAIGRDSETGASATPEEKFAAMQETAERLANGGPWNAVGGGEGTTKRGVLFTALCELFPGKSPDEIRDWLGGKSKAEQAKLRKSEKVAAKIAEIQARSGDADAGDDMLDELGAE